MFKSLIVILSVFFIAVVLQLLFGNLELALFAFPVNVVLLVLLFALLYWGKQQHKKWFLLLSSKTFALTSLIATLLMCILLGLTPQLSIEQLESSQSILKQLGIYQIISSYPFVSIQLVLTVALIAVLLRKKLQKNMRSVAFFVAHVGLLLTLVGAFWGRTDEQRFKLMIAKKDTTAIAYEDDNTITQLPFAVQLINFEIDRYSEGSSKQYFVTIEITQENTPLHQVTLQVNHPCTYQGYKIYPYNYKQLPDGTIDYCVLLLVKQPWEWILLLGIYLLLTTSVLLLVTIKKENR